MVLWLISLPIPLFPSVCATVPGSTIELQVDWPHNSSVEIWGNVFVLENSEILSQTVMAIDFRDEGAAGSIVTDDRVVSEENTGASEYATSVIMDKIVVFACAKDSTATSRPSNLPGVRRSKMGHRIHRATVADDIFEVMGSCKITSKIMWLEDYVGRALCKIVDLVEIFKNNVLKECFRVKDFLPANNIET